jgi:hypothetical protein
MRSLLKVKVESDKDLKSAERFIGTLHSSSPGLRTCRGALHE